MKICRDIFESCAAWRWNVLLRPLIVGADMSVAANIGVRCEASCSDTFSLHSLALMSSDKALLCRPVIYCNVLIDVYLCLPRWVSAWQTAWKQIFSQALTSRRKWNLSSALCFSLEFVVVLFFLHTHDKIRKRAGKYPLTSFMLCPKSGPGANSETWTAFIRPLTTLFMAISVTFGKFFNELLLLCFVTP